MGLEAPNKKSQWKGGFRFDGASKDAGMESAWPGAFVGQPEEMTRFEKAAALLRSHQAEVGPLLWCTGQVVMSNLVSV